jgi:hypothetical protein
VEDPAEHPQGGLKVHIMVQVPPSGGEKKAWHRRGAEFVQHINP